MPRRKRTVTPATAKKDKNTTVVQGWGRDHGGELPSTAWRPATSDARRKTGTSPDENRKGGSQPAHQSRSTDVQRARLLPCTATSTWIRTQGAGMKKRDLPLESGHQSGAAFPRLRLIDAGAAAGRVICRSGDYAGAMVERARQFHGSRACRSWFRDRNVGSS